MMASDDSDDLRPASVTYAQGNTGEDAIKLLNDVYKFSEDAPQPIHVRWATGAKAAPPLLPKAGVNGQVPSWQYWDWCSGTSSCPPLTPYGGAALPADEKFLMADMRGAGWNNNRQSLELAYALAFVWRRTLVLPARFGNPCDPRDLHDVNVSFDVQAMATGIKVITAEDFVAYAKANPNRFPGGATAVERFHIYPKDRWSKIKDWRDVTGWFTGTEGVALKLWDDIKEVPPYVIIGGTPEAAELAKIRETGHFKRFATKERLNKVLALSEKEASATALYIQHRKLLGNYYSLIYVPNPMIAWQLRNTVRRALHLRSEYFEAADAAMQVAGLRPGEYSSMHNRQGDFEWVYKVFYFDPKDPARFLASPQNMNVMRQYGKMWMAYNVHVLNPIDLQTQPLRNIFIPALQKEMPEPKKIFNLAAEVNEVAKARVGHLPGWQGLVDMIICAQAGIFLGNWGSTFTGYIHRLRGYMPLIDDKRLLYTDSTMSDNRSSPLWSVGSNIRQMSWVREWPEGFQ